MKPSINIVMEEVGFKIVLDLEGDRETAKVYRDKLLAAMATSGDDFLIDQASLLKNQVWIATAYSKEKNELLAVAAGYSEKSVVDSGKKSLPDHVIKAFPIGVDFKETTDNIVDWLKSIGIAEPSQHFHLLSVFCYSGFHDLLRHLNVEQK